MGNRAIIYIRVSSADQGRGWSLQTQEQLCRVYCESAGLVVTAVLADEESGFTTEREGLACVLEILHLGEAQHLVVYSLDRLNRDFAQSVLTRENIRKSGAMLHIAERGGVAGEDTIMLDNLEALVAHREGQAFRERTHRGRKAKAESGLLLGGGRAPYGYKRVGKGRNAQWDISEPEATTVRLIFSWFVTEQLGAREIVKRLAEQGRLTAADLNSTYYRKRQDQAGWSKMRVYQILRCTTYKGEAHQTLDGKLYIVKVPLIVESSMWSAAQDRMTKLPNGRLPSTHEYLCTSHIRCGCGYALVGWHTTDKGRLYKYYRCCTGFYGCVANNGEPCGYKSIPVLVVDSLVWNWIVEISMNLDEANVENQKYRYDYRGRIAVLNQKNLELDGQIAVREQKISRLVDLYLDGVLPRELLDEKRQMLEGELIHFQQSKSELQVDIEALAAYDDNNSANELIMQLRQDAESVSFADRRRLMRLLEVKIVAKLERNSTGDVISLDASSKYSTKMLHAFRIRPGMPWKL